ncbi:MAG: glutamate decarboxylase [Bacillota bacterium]|nr:glutamate decarboxylase [Bacillota bacterium]
MWTVVYIAPNQSAGEKIKARLEEEGLLVSLRPVNLSCTGESCQYELLVPESEAEEAQQYLALILKSL